MRSLRKEGGSVRIDALFQELLVGSECFHWSTLLIIALFSLFKTVSDEFRGLQINSLKLNEH